MHDPDTPEGYCALRTEFAEQIAQCLLDMTEGFEELTNNISAAMIEALIVVAARCEAKMLVSRFGLQDVYEQIVVQQLVHEMTDAIRKQREEAQRDTKGSQELRW